MGQTIGEVVRQYFPDATDIEVEFIVLEKTGYPRFWLTDNPEAEFRSQLMDFKREILWIEPEPC
ncbi:MAG: hypothetical protein PHV11_06765 [Candidatus Bipolaricaulis sp.]|nr:hypothetical protein [Candidatus Bipolaricaulis sp.]MDD5220248.1 hypothetical protein [Candidatus Bipolaricaulis sp.]